MGFSGRALLRLAIPAALLALALILRPYLPSLGAEAMTLLTKSPYLLAIVSGVLALQFNRSRFLLLSLVTAGTYWLIQSRLQVSLSEPLAATTYTALSIGLPAIFLFLLAVPERVENQPSRRSLSLSASAWLSAVRSIRGPMMSARRPMSSSTKPSKLAVIV